MLKSETKMHGAQFMVIAHGVQAGRKGNFAFYFKGLVRTVEGIARDLIANCEGMEAGKKYNIKVTFEAEESEEG